MMKACLKDTGDNMKELQMTKAWTVLETKYMIELKWNPYNKVIISQIDINELSQSTNKLWSRDNFSLQ